MITLEMLEEIKERSGALLIGLTSSSKSVAWAELRVVSRTSSGRKALVTIGLAPDFVSQADPIIIVDVLVSDIHDSLCALEDKAS